MEKQIRDFKINYSLNWTFDVEIKKMKEDLEALEKIGATHIEIEPYNEYNCCYVSIDVISRRLETDEEYKQRVEEINVREAQIMKKKLK